MNFVQLKFSNLDFLESRTILGRKQLSDNVFVATIRSVTKELEIPLIRVKFPATKAHFII